MSCLDLSLAIEARVDEGADARVVANLDVLDVFPNLRRILHNVTTYREGKKVGLRLRDPARQGSRNLGFN